MSQEQSKTNKNNKKRWRIALISFVLIYILFRSGPSLFASRSKTILPENSLVEDKVQAKAIIIKKEYLYKAYGKGKVEVLSEEGEKLAAGSKVARLTLLKDDSLLNQDLKEIDNKIATLKSMEKNEDMTKNEEDNTEKNVDDLIDDIQKNISQEDYENIVFLKDKLFIYEGKENNVSGEGTLIKENLNSLKDKREEIINQISSNSKDYFSEEPGIVSFKIDGYEELYSFNHKDEYNLLDFQKLENEQNLAKNKDSIETGDSIFKIIDNFEWYMIINVEDMNDIESYEEGDAISISGDETVDNMHGHIEKINKEKNEGLILCKFNTDFEKYYDERYMEINIVKKSQVGYKIPTKSVVEKDDMKGVYVKDISGIIKFRPIRIITQEDKTTCVECGDENNNIQIEGHEEPFKTISLFDEIFLNTINIKEGMVIN